MVFHLVQAQAQFSDVYGLEQVFVSADGDAALRIFKRTISAQNRKARARLLGLGLL